MWIARDKYGDLWLYEEKPFRKDNYQTSINEDCSSLINSDWFPEVSWEDEEHRELVLKPINKKNRYDQEDIIQ